MAVAEHFLDLIGNDGIEIVGSEIMPLIKPIRCFFGASASSKGTTFTMGLPALAMMNASPFAAFSISRDRCVFAFAVGMAASIDLVHQT